MSTEDRPISRTHVLIGDYLRGEWQGQSGQAQPDAARILLSAIVTHSLYGEQLALAEFSNSLRQLAERVNAETRPVPPPVATVAAELLGQYDEARRELEKRQAAEIHSIVLMFHRSLAGLTSGGERWTGRMQLLERDLRHASRLGDLAALQGRLRDVLEFIRKEREAEAGQTTGLVQGLRADFGSWQRSMAESGVGLPGRECALAQLRRVWTDNAAVALIRIDQLRPLVERHGNETAQRLIALLLNDTARSVEMPYLACLWAQTGILLIFDQLAGREQARDRVRAAIASIPVDFSLDVASRKTFFRLPHRWLVLGADEAPDLNAAIEQLDSFLAP